MNLEILKIASNTKNFKDIKKYTHHSKSKNPLCGDEIHIKLVISDQKIIDFGYQGKSCIYCQATASILSNKLVNYKTFKINELCDYDKTSKQIIKSKKHIKARMYSFTFQCFEKNSN